MKILLVVGVPLGVVAFVPQAPRPLSSMQSCWSRGGRRLQRRRLSSFHSCRSGNGLKRRRSENGQVERGEATLLRESVAVAPSPLTVEEMNLLEGGDEDDEFCLVEFSPGSVCIDPNAIVIPEEEELSSPSYLKSLGTLLVITWMWALNTPAVRYMYNAVDHGPPTFVINFGSALSALITVLIVGGVQEAKRASDVAAAEAAAVKAGMVIPTRKERTPFFKDTEAIRGGLELGAYKVLGVGFNYLGISLTLSSQAAFFVQLTTIMVPIAQSLMGVKLGTKVWTAALMAFSGVALLAVDGASSASAGQLHDLLLGNAFCLAAAFWYSCYDIRVNIWGRRTKVLPLTASKTLFQTLFSFSALAVVSQLDLPMSEEIRHWFVSVTPDELKLIGAVTIFSGAFANGVATLLQVTAQNEVGPSRAQLIYATNPLWNTLVATVFLGEQINAPGYAGALLFFGALAIAATTPPEPVGEAVGDTAVVAAGVNDTAEARDE